MKKRILAPLALLALTAGCAGADQKAAEESQQKLLRETMQRVGVLERHVAGLDSQIAGISNRVYEVRGRNGKRTGMTVVPVAPVAPPPAAAPQARPDVVMTPNGPARAVRQPAPSDGHAKAAPTRTPAYAATPAAAPHQARPDGSRPAPAQGSGAPAAQAALGLPPEGATPPPAPAQAKPAATPQAKPTPSAQAKPAVPAMPAADLALPPEDPALGLPPMDNAPKPAAGAASRPAAPQAAAPLPPPAPHAPTAAPGAAKGEDAAYKAAVRPALAGRSAESIQQFQAFLQRYPGGRYAANAEYWIGEAYYAQGKYREALAQFEKVDAAYPRHHKTADALLKKGLTLRRMGDSAGAAEAYRQLRERFPQSEAARRIRGR